MNRPSIELPLLDSSRFGATRITPIGGYCRPGTVPAARGYDSRSLQILDDSPDPVSASLFLFRENISISPFIVDDVRDSVDRGRDNDGER